MDAVSRSATIPNRPNAGRTLETRGNIQKRRAQQGTVLQDPNQPPLFYNEKAATSVVRVGQEEGTVQTGNDLYKLYFRHTGPAGDPTQKQNDQPRKTSQHGPESGCCPGP